MIRSPYIVSSWIIENVKDCGSVVASYGQVDTDFNMKVAQVSRAFGALK